MSYQVSIIFVVSSYDHDCVWELYEEWTKWGTRQLWPHSPGLGGDVEDLTGGVDAIGGPVGQMN